MDSDMPEMGGIDATVVIRDWEKRSAQTADADLCDHGECDDGR